MGNSFTNLLLAVYKTLRHCYEGTYKALTLGGRGLQAEIRTLLCFISFLQHVNILPGVHSCKGFTVPQCRGKKLTVLLRNVTLVLSTL